ADRGQLAEEGGADRVVHVAVRPRPDRVAEREDPPDQVGALSTSLLGARSAPSPGRRSAGLPSPPRTGARAGHTGLLLRLPELGAVGRKTRPAHLAPVLGGEVAALRRG